MVCICIYFVLFCIWAGQNRCKTIRFFLSVFRVLSRFPHLLLQSSLFSSLLFSSEAQRSCSCALSTMVRHLHLHLHLHFFCVLTLLSVCFNPLLSLSFDSRFLPVQARGLKKHLKRLNAPRHWMLDKLGGAFVRSGFLSLCFPCPSSCL